MRAEYMALIGAFLVELHPGRLRERPVSPEAKLERDLGIDSIARTELVLRTERAFRVRLAVGAVTEAETVEDLFRAVCNARPGEGKLTAPPVSRPMLPPVSAAVDAATLLDVVACHADRHPLRLHVTVLEDDQTVTGTLTYGALRDRGRRVAGGLLARNVEPGDRIALMLPTGVDFFAAFIGILYAGCVPVPIYPPARPSQIEDHLRRQAGILSNAGARILVTVPEARRLATLLSGRVESLAAVETVADLSAVSSEPAFPAPPTANTTALIQYTSGSTGDPKGVVLTHANVLANIRAMGVALQASAADVFVSWLPLYHDMGLIGAWMGCLYHAAPLYVMPPTSFLVRPESWLRTIHRYRATLSAAPNFGFDLCVNKITDGDMAGLDLSSLRSVANGSEPVSGQSVRRFLERFAPFGFRAEAMAPVYGLAECAVGLAFPPVGRPPIFDRIDREALTHDGVAAPARADDVRAVELVGCGQALAGHEIRVVDDIDRELPDRREGRIEFRGPSATAGYFRNPEKTRELIRAGWLDSGDRGYTVQGEIFITGRVKDIIIRGGHNIYPQELEEAVATLPGIRKGGVAVFGTADPASGTEQLVVLAETREAEPKAKAGLTARIVELGAEILGTPPERVILVPPRSIPKTSSGKLRRSAARSLYERGLMGAKPRDVRWQIVRLASGNLIFRARHLARLAAVYLYAGWWWTAFAACYGAGGMAVMILPKLQWRWRAVRGLARAALFAMAVPLKAETTNRIPPDKAVLVFNHSSYLDVVLLAAFLPGEPVFVAKQELALQKFAGPVLRRLGAVFVERYDLGGSAANVATVADRAREGRLLVFFPEGSFTRRPGLSEFYLGAFRIAAEAGLPVIPGVLRGTREMLRSDQWFPQRTALEISIGDPIEPAGSDFTAVLKLRDTARAAILDGCGEPDLSELVKPDAPSESVERDS